VSTARWVTRQLDHWAAAAGDRPFFHYGEDGLTLTYADFARRTDAIAGNLAANGVAAPKLIVTEPRLLPGLNAVAAWLAGNSAAVVHDAPPQAACPDPGRARADGGVGRRLDRTDHGHDSADRGGSRR
jgi:hypothetical protein